MHIISLICYNSHHFAYINAYHLSIMGYEYKKNVIIFGRIKKKSYLCPHIFECSSPIMNIAFLRIVIVDKNLPYIIVPTFL